MAYSEIDHRWTPFNILNQCDDLDKSCDGNIALLILNRSTSCKQTLKTLWNKSVLKIAVDGGANILHDTCAEANILNQHIPDIISGDFDSAEQHIIDYYKQMGVEVISTPDQDHTDFTKALKLTVSRLQDTNRQVDAIITLTSLGERLDHVFANINTLFFAEKLTPIPIYLVSDDAITWLLHPGDHVIEIPDDLLKVNCGLLPIGEPCSNVTTDGLKWNLKNQTMKFGGLVSTSNTFTSTQVNVQCDKHLLFTMERLLPSNTSQVKL